jgi:hypothetical protein
LKEPTHKCLTIAGATSTDNNVNAVRFNCDGDLSRTWLLKDMGGAFWIQNAKTNKETARRTTWRLSNSIVTAIGRESGDSTEDSLSQKPG